MGVFAPVAGRSSARFGERAVTIFGAILCTTGMMISSQAPGIIVLLFTYGLTVGVGTTCVLVSGFSIVSKYFYKRRSLALAVISLGAAGGNALINPLAQEFLNLVTWRYAFMFIAGLEFLVCFLAIPFDQNVVKMEADQVDMVPRNDFHETTTTWSIMTSLARNSPFLIITMAMTIGSLGHVIPSVHLVSALIGQFALASCGARSLGGEGAKYEILKTQRTAHFPNLVFSPLLLPPSPPPSPSPVIEERS